MDVLLTNAIFFQNERPNKKIHSILIKRGKIADIFYDKKRTPFDVKKINLNNKFVTVGCVDSHTHSFEGGLYSMGANLAKVKSVSEALELMKAKCSNDQYIFAYSFDENGVDEKRFPTRSELDNVFPDRPVLLRRVDGHSCVINTFAAERIEKLGRKGSSWNGLLRKEENDIAAHWFHNNLPDEMILKAYRKAANLAVKAGLTTVHTMIGDANMALNHFKLIQENLHRFDVKFKLYPQSFNIEAAKKTGVGRIGGCILVDGSIGSETAAIGHAYENSDENGILYQTDEFWNKFIMESHRNDLQIAVHAIGDRAVEQILTQYEKAKNTSPKKAIKHQIIHCELMKKDQIRRMSKAKIAAVIQPMFDQLWGNEGGFYENKVGYLPAQRMNRFKRMIDAGILVCGSSDWYITTLDIRKQLNALMKHHKEDQRLSFSQALKLYTQNPATLIGEEETAGRMQVGYDADFTIFSRNPINRNIVRDTKIEGVLVDGKLIKAEQ
jgi:predicted amidohydrolase YtcJ